MYRLGVDKQTGFNFLLGRDDKIYTCQLKGGKQQSFEIGKLTVRVQHGDTENR